jgi:2-methylcitrate dehydratase PrpD
MAAETIDFILGLNYAHIPESARRSGRRLLLDTLGTAAAGRGTQASRILRGHAAAFHGAGTSGARMLFDGRRVAPPGAALAGAGTIDAVDAHDGHRLTKGHAGVTVLPGLLAFCDEIAPCSGTEFLTRLVLGYEVATRAGIALHASVADYHTSGAWNALGAAAVGARALGLGGSGTRHALGIAEYYGPRSQMMRVIDHPTMLKDGSTMGAFAGVSAALLAADGFTGAPAITVTDDAVAEIWADLGQRWTVEEQYIKAYPVCRWAQPAVEALLSLRAAVLPAGFEAIARVEIHSFAEAVRLATRAPRSTDEAQYSLPFPAAAALVHGALGLAEIDGPGLRAPQVLALSEAMVLIENQDYSARFPAERWAHAEITLADGRRYRSAPFPARGDPEAPFSDEEVTGKFRHLAGSSLESVAVEELVDICRGVDRESSTARLLDLVTAPPLAAPQRLERA